MHERLRSNAPVIRIGTRGSRLALVQAELVRDRLVEAHGLARDDFELVVISTRGDREQDRSLSEIGGKGLFCSEIERELLAGRIDIAVHSMKDMPFSQPGGLAIDCVLPRGDPEDALISGRYSTILAIPPGSRIGTSSVRRRAQLLHLRKGIEVVGFRGNVETRLRKLSEGEVDATMLAVEGLRRLGISGSRIHPVAQSEMVPAPAQGAICVERRRDDQSMAGLLEPANDPVSRLACEAERIFMHALGGDCTSPVAALARISDGGIRITGELLDPDGRFRVRKTIEGDAGEARELARTLAGKVLGEMS